MRLAGRAKLGYYPTPLEVVDLLRPALTLPDYAPTNFLDPCAGEGTALARLRADNERIRTVGIEADAARARRARSVLAAVLHQDLFAVRISPARAGLLLLNPPYDSDDSGRLELEFLRHTWEALAPEGVLLFIVALPTAQSRATARFISGHFTDICVRRFPGRLFESFRQVVVFARRRDREGVPDDDAIGQYAQMAQDPPELTDRSRPRRLAVPEVYEQISLHDGSVPPERLASMLAGSPLAARLAEWLRVDGSAVEPPVLPLHAGHIALMLASGALNGIVGDGEDRHVVVGQPVKVVQTVTEVTEDDTEITRERERFQVRIRAMKATGEVIELTQ